MVVEQKLTLEQYLELPEDKPYREFIDGEVIAKVAPRQSHGIVQMALGPELFDAADRAGFMVGSEVRYIFGTPERAYLPDVALVSWDRAQLDERGRLSSHQRLAPDLAIEVLSPGQNASLLLDRVAFFLKHGVRLLLLIDDEREQAMVYRPGTEPELVSTPGRIDLAPVLPGASVDLGSLFRRLRPPG